MSLEQTAIPAEQAPVVETGPCAWCGKTTNKRIEIEPARFTKAANGVKVMKKSPIMAFVCDDHNRSLERSKKDGSEAGVAIR